MTFKPAFKKDVREICSKLRSEFFVGEYEMAIQWMNEDNEEDGKKTLASIPIDTRYLNFRVQIYPILQKYWLEDRHEFLNTLIHEFSHLLTEPLYLLALKSMSEREQDYLEEVRERQTQRITNVISPYLLKKLSVKKPKKVIKKKTWKKKNQ